MTEKRIWAHAVTGEDDTPLMIAHLMEASNDPGDDPDLDMRTPICSQNFGGRAGGIVEWTYMPATPLAVRCEKCLRIEK